MKSLKRNAAVLTAAAVIGAVGIGGVMSANADSPQHSGGKTQVEQSDGDGEAPDSTEAANDGETNDDATDVGPDANPNEPGHQDASDSTADGEAPDSTEAENDGETNDDATDVGPDANPNEPGHQDASDNGQQD
ncbi:MAG: hypothetical protein JWN22_174 [Nocardioides sp.]|nr:hypothetical protein [Nocardioides sp.]